MKYTFVIAAAFLSLAVVAHAEGTCSGYHEACVKGTTSRGDLRGYDICGRALRACKQTGVWDTTFTGSSHGKYYTNVAKK